MPRTKIRIYCVLIAGLALCATGLFWPTMSTRRQFTVAANIWPGSERLFLARGAPEFKNVPATFMEFSWSAPVLGSFRKRVADAAVVSLDELLRLEATDAQPQAVLVLGVSKGSDALFSRPGIASVAGLRGRKVGVEVHSSGEHFLFSMLHKNGLTPEDVEIVPLNLAETETAYLERDLDAVVTTDPWRARLAEKGARLLADSTDMGLEMSRVLVVRRESGGKFRDETLRLIRGCLQQEPASSWKGNQLAAMLRREDLTAAQWESALKLVHMPDLAENLRFLETELPVVLQRVADQMRKTGRLSNDKVIDTDSLLNTEFVKEGL